MSEDTTPPEDTESTETYQQPSAPPTRIGHYRILEKLGEGGMGEVYLAEQDDPRRKVALKLIKWGMDTKQVMARFEAERQALALMDHPNIAKVFDAGATEQGRPYFVMEYVKGVPITKHCDRQRLTTRERLELFMHVCEGVQHAHQKAVIHRDIKPSNILVTIQDGNAVPKIIDFGVAKATAQRLTEKTVYTELGQLIGTPEYMSPEQAEMTAQDVDTRTDVYSLGAVLYELLVGARPFESAELRLAGFDEIRRKIREDEPSKPSARISSLGDKASSEAARRRRTDFPTLRRQLRHDLDWITMKAMEKDRARRYGSPSELGADIGRHVRHEPVLASPPSATYRAGKFLRRHRAGTSLAAVSVLVLIGFSLIITIQAARLAAERDRANAAAARASREAQTSASTTAFLGRMLGGIDAKRLGAAFLDTLRAGVKEEDGAALTSFDSAVRRVNAADVSRRTLDNVVLQAAVDNIEEELGEAPLLAARLRYTIGRVYLELGLWEQAAFLLEQALHTQEFVGKRDPNILQDLAWVRMSQSRADEAESLFAEVLEERRQLHGTMNELTFTAMIELANAYQMHGKYTQAESLLRDTLKLQRYRFSVCYTKSIMGAMYLNRRLPRAAALEFNELPEFCYFKVLPRWPAKIDPVEYYGSKAGRQFTKRKFLGLVLYQLARVSARRGDRAIALEFLRQVLNQGYVVEGVPEDLHLVSLHGDPEFEAIVAEVKKRITEQEASAPTE